MMQDITSGLSFLQTNTSSITVRWKTYMYVYRERRKSIWLCMCALVLRTTRTVMVPGNSSRGQLYIQFAVRKPWKAGWGELGM